uniref:cytochrome c oxidase subunit II n=1 Tax=Cellana toreuma TaxID=42758 RepID=UPI0020290321|nr:cytochrome c oxidase subunit II [Cellana toreuma]UPX89399.1 cytochrome c oxidase subunit II [Cellana toreuma]WNO18542.1 cytochrome c oxidase subunit II [Cellana toreuma]
MSRYSQLGFMDASSLVMEQLIFFHDHAMVVLVFIVFLVGYLMVYLMFSSLMDRNGLDGQVIEIVWTILPAVILVFLALPSLRLLYLMDDLGSCFLTIKCVGHQWYWSYEYSDFVGIAFDSYMLPADDLEIGEYRLLEVDNRVIVPSGLDVRVLVSSEDVIHSWTVPSLGVKADAVPGRLNQISFHVMYPGVYYGQCSEICGANHSFMPICLEGVDLNSFMTWVKGVESSEEF